MQPQYLNSSDAQSAHSAYSEDINQISEDAALADDRVLAELFRLAPYSSAADRCVLPYRVSGSSVDSSDQTIVLPTTRGVIVQPFRALIGSRAAASAGGLANWQDVNSAIMVGTSALNTTLELDANPTADARLDLVYAAVAVNADHVTADRLVKDGPGQVTKQSLVTQIMTHVTIAVAKGTVDPVPPPLPADAAGTWYVPLAVVAVPPGFRDYGTDTLIAKNIWELSPQALLSGSTQANTTSPPDQGWKLGGTVMARISDFWTTGVRPPAYLPPTMCGSESLIIPIDLAGPAGDGNGVSHNSLDTVDASRDWRNRVFTIHVCAKSAATRFSWDADSGTLGSMTPEATRNSSSAATFYSGFAQSFVADTYGGAVATASTLVALMHSILDDVGSGAAVALYVDQADGKLKIHYSGAPLCKLFFWINASGPYANAH